MKSNSWSDKALCFIMHNFSSILQRCLCKKFSICWLQWFDQEVFCFKEGKLDSGSVDLPQKRPQYRGHATARERIARRQKAATINFDGREHITQDGTPPNKPERAPLLDPSSPDTPDDVFEEPRLEKEKDLQRSPEHYKRHSENLAGRRSHLVRQDDLRDRSLTPPTPPVDIDNNKTLDSKNESKKAHKYEESEL